MKLNQKRISKILSFSIAIAGFLLPTMGGIQAAHADTTERPWSALGKSLDGSKLIAGTWGAGLFISSDSGANWVRVTPDTSTATNATSNTAFNSRCYTPFLWTAVAISNDGQTLVGGSWGCGLWVSIDGGVSWRQRSTTISGFSQFGSRYKWYSVALSADASRVYGVNNNSGIEAGYTNSSTALWQLLSAADNSNATDLTQVYVTPDGNLYAKDSLLKLYKVTPDLNARTFNETPYDPNGVTNFQVGAIDVVNTGDTFTIYAAKGKDSSGPIVRSRDGGTTWTQLNLPTDKKWLRVSASTDGQKIIGIASYSNSEQFLKSTTYTHLWISTDSGNTWTSPDSASTDHHWSEVKVLPDGSFIAVDGQETPLYAVTPLNTSLAWNPLPTASNSVYTALPVPHTGNIWRSNSAGTNWVIVDPTFFGGPAGRSTLGANETTTVIFDPDQTLGQPKLIFASSAPGATVTVTPTTDPTYGTSSPFAVGARILDIAVVGVTGDTQICVDGTSSERMWHYRSSAWEDITTSHTSTQVCGTTSSFSPFAIGPVRTAAQNTSSGAREAQEAREKAVAIAKNEIITALANGKSLTVNLLLKSDFTGVTSNNIGLINSELSKLSAKDKENLKELEKIVFKFATVDKVAEGRPYTANELVSAGLISQNSKIKSSIVASLKKLPGSALDSYEKIKAAVASFEKSVADRKARLAATLDKRR